MRFTTLAVVVDNRAREGFRSCWGLSLLLTGDKTVLFDAGPSGEELLHNLSLYGQNPADIDLFFLSHSHVDHSGGLRALQDAGFTGDVIMCDRTLSSGDRERTAEQGLQQPGMGLIAIRLESGGLWEQSLLADTPVGRVLLVGCAHPGLKRIWEVACTQEIPFGVVGGFHDAEPFPDLGQARLLGPCHCTKQREAFRKDFPSSFLDLAAGDRIRLDSEAL
ncbi:MAG: MBL fold metallo-hydrolase [Actinobacteria bacterium]|nr:MBL fold metallo-hydrolase [Actinomycetota bacterium]